MADLTLYTNPMSRGRIARWMLEEVGAHYDVELVDWANKPEALLAINPMGKVPAIRHGERVVTETAAICAYLADAFPEAGLAPAADDRADYYRWMFFAAGPLEQAVVNRALGVADPEGQKQGMAGYGSFDRTIDTLEAMLDGCDFVACGRFTAADVYVGAHVMWGLQFGSIPKRSAFERYVARVAARDAHARASALDDAMIPPPAD